MLTSVISRVFMFIYYYTTPLMHTKVKCYTAYMTIERCDDKEQWDDLVNDLGGHPLQLWGWGELKGAHHWRPTRLLWQQDGIVKGGAQLLVRPLPWPFGRLTYVPRGPFGELADSAEAMAELAAYCKHNIGGVLVSAEPDKTAVEWGVSGDIPTKQS